MTSRDARDILRAMGLERTQSKASGEVFFAAVPEMAGWLSQQGTTAPPAPAPY